MAKRRRKRRGFRLFFLLMLLAGLLAIKWAGTVSLVADPGAGGTLTGAGWYFPGAKITVAARPQAGWEFVGWTVRGETVSETPEYTFTVAGKIELKAQFRPLDLYAMEALARGRGSVAVSAQQVVRGEVVVFTAQPEPGYRFAYWEEDGEFVSAEAVYSFAAQAPRNLRAVFVPEEYRVDLEVEGDGEVVETWSLEPARVTLKAVPREGYEFFGWVDMDTEQEIETEAVLSFAWKGGRRLMARFRPQLVHVDGDSLMAVVSKQTTIGQYAPDDLVYLPADYSSGKARLRREAAEALDKMYRAALADGVKLYVVSAYRDYQKQTHLFYRYAKEDGIFEAERYSARPGQSEHQLGTTVDFGGTSTGLTEAFFHTPQGQWLYNNAHKFGFALSYPKGSEEITGYIFEPWHYRYIGVELAREWKESGLTLVEFLIKKNQAF